MLPDLLKQIRSDEPIASVTAPFRDIGSRNAPVGQWMNCMNLLG